MRQDERRARTITALLDAAAASFAQNGYEGTSLDAVATTAGFSKGAVYAHFTAKLEIFLAVFARVLPDARQRLERVAALLAAGRDPALAARAYFEGEPGPVHIGVMSEAWQVALGEPAVRERLEEFRSERLARLGQAAIDAGQAPAAALQTAGLTARLIDGWTLEYRLQRAASA